MDRRGFLAGVAAASFAGVARAHASVEGLKPFIAERIARRYRVAQSAVDRVAVLAAKHFPSDPPLLLALIGIESSWRPWAAGAAGEIGLCQVRPGLHGASAAELIDPEANIATAARVLRRCLDRAGGDMRGALRRYNGRGPAAERYATKVLRERRRLIAPSWCSSPSVERPKPGEPSIFD